MPQNVKSNLPDKFWSFFIYFFNYDGKVCSLCKLQEIFQIRVEGREIAPRPQFESF